LGQSVEDVRRSYESIRTGFSRYLQQRRGKSRSGVEGTPLEPKFEHLRWWLSFCNTRQSTGYSTGRLLYRKQRKAII